MQALESLFRCRVILHRARECVVCTRYSSSRSLSRSKNCSIPLHLPPRKRTSLSYRKFLPLSAVQTLCSVPVSRQVFDSKVSPETESPSFEFHVQEPTVKFHQAGIHSAPTSKSDTNFPQSDDLTIYLFSKELALDSNTLKFLRYTPFSCSEYSTDSFELDLFRCADVPDVLEVLEANVNDLSVENASMAVSKLWQIISHGFVNNLHDLYSPYLPVYIPQNSVLDKLLLVIENDFQHLSDVKISCLMAHIYCLGLAQNSFLVHKMLHHFVPHCDTLPLEILARILLFLRSPELNHFIKGKFMPRLVECLTDCNNESDFILIDHCIENAQRLLPTAICELHSKKISELLDAGEICNEDTKVLMRVLQSIIMAKSTLEYHEVLTRVCSLLMSKVNCLETSELITLSNYCWQHKLGHQLMKSVYHQAALAMQETTDPVTRAHLFLSVSPERALSLQSEMVLLVRNLMRSPCTDPYQMKALYLLFRSRAFSDLDLLNEFWDKVLNDLDETLSHREFFRNDALRREATISRVLFRYLHFNNNLGGQYRHRRLEARIIELIHKELNGVAGLVIGRLARMASFLVAYSDPRELSWSVVARLLECVSQFQLRDVALLTRGLQMSQSLNSSCHYEKYVTNLVSLAHMLSACIQRLAAESTDVNDLAMLSRLSPTIDTVFSKHGVRYSSIISRSNSSWLRNLLPSVFQAPPLPPPATSSYHSQMPVEQLPHPPPSEEWSSSPSLPIVSLDVPPTMSPSWNEVSSAGDAKEWPTQACVALSLAQNVDTMNSRAASVLAQVYGRSNFYNVQVLDGLLDYLYRNQYQTHGLMVAQALDCAYRMGHAPDLPLEALRALASVLAQDLSSMHGLPLLNSLLALSFYQSLSSSLIKKIFNVGFMDFLDEEMQHSFSKKHYPVRVRQVLMELNRSVCIDYPESNVPWFHEEYCRDFIQTVQHKRDGFFAEVHRVLAQVLGDDRLFSSQTYSPYYYLMDFSFVLNDEGKAVMQPDKPSALQPRTPETLTPLPPGYTRHCIDLMNPPCYVKRHSVSGAGKASVQPQLKGHMQLRQRHLEVLGYDVINIARHDWQSMSLGTPASKEDYLRNKIFSGRL